MWINSNFEACKICLPVLQKNGEKIELDGDTDFLHINWDKFYDIIEQAYLMDIKRMESLKDFDNWKEWKNSK